MKSRIILLMMLAGALALPPAALILAQQAGAGHNGNMARPQGPCDIYAAAGNPCVAAHSTTRALLASYHGPLYELKRQSDGKTLDIGVVLPTASDPGGYADAAAQDAFCADTLCVINHIYDQSGHGNDLLQAPPGPRFPGPAKGGFDTQPIADMAPVSIMGHKAYGVFIMPGMGFRNNNAKDLAVNDDPEGIYYVIDGKHFDSGCCFDYGNAETNSGDNGPGTMETAYFGTSTTWGSGSGAGPWIMGDMEAGLYSGYNAHQNPADPTIDAWRFVTAVVDGGGGNKWDLRGGNAQSGALKTFYSGARPGSQENSRYFPMRKQGGILLGTGGDNGNGSSGTFYEGVMTTGFPSESTTDAVQANIVAAKYDGPQVGLSHVALFTPGAAQDVTVTFTNTSGKPATGVTLSIAALPPGWTYAVPGSAETPANGRMFSDPVAPGAAVSAIFKITASASLSGGGLTARAQWSTAAGQKQAETAIVRVRSAPLVKINEVQFGSPSAPGQFIELYNASATDVDISNWSLLSTQSQWAPLQLATIPPGTKIAAKGFYLLGLASSGLAAPAHAGDAVIHVRGTAGFEAGQEITIDGETRKIKAVGTPATPMTTVFIPISTGPWITIPARSSNLPVVSTAGFAVGEKISIDVGGNDELATVTAVGKAGTQTTLSSAVPAGAGAIRVGSAADITSGDTLVIGTGSRRESVTVKSVSMQEAQGTAGQGGGFAGGRGGRGGMSPGIIELAAPLKQDHATGVDVSDRGTGVSFTPATQFAHISGDAVQALGSGITLESALATAHRYGAAIVNPQAAAAGYQGPPAPHQWFGDALSSRAGSLALMEASGKVVVDAIVYGSQQSNSSGNGTIASPELATLENDQGRGGCIVVVPTVGRGGRGRGAPGSAASSPSAGRATDGADTGSNCTDFALQPPTPGAPNGH